MPRQFPPEFRQRALRMLEEALPEHETEYAAIQALDAHAWIATCTRGGRSHDDPRVRGTRVRGIRRGLTAQAPCAGCSATRYAIHLSGDRELSPQGTGGSLPLGFEEGCAAGARAQADEDPRSVGCRAST